MDTMSAISRQDDPPPPGPRVEVYKVAPKVGFQGQILSSYFWGVWIHWDGYRSRECLADTSACHGCNLEMPRRWKGYLCVWHAVHKQVGFVELTPAAANQIADLVPGKKMRGYTLRLKRTGEKCNGRLIVDSVAAPLGPTDKMPEALDPEDTLRKLWGWGRAK